MEERRSKEEKIKRNFVLRPNDSDFSGRNSTLDACASVKGYDFVAGTREEKKETKRKHPWVRAFRGRCFVTEGWVAKKGICERDTALCDAAQGGSFTRSLGETRE